MTAATQDRRRETPAQDAGRHAEQAIEHALAHLATEQACGATVVRIETVRALLLAGGAR